MASLSLAEVGPYWLAWPEFSSSQGLCGPQFSLFLDWMPCCLSEEPFHLFLMSPRQTLQVDSLISGSFYTHGKCRHLMKKTMFILGQLQASQVPESQMGSQDKSFPFSSSTELSSSFSPLFLSLELDTYTHTHTPLSWSPWRELAVTNLTSPSSYHHRLAKQ